MKYYTRKWSEDPFDNPRVMLEYEKYYETVENQIPDNIRKIIRERHDTHISKAYLEKNDYIMEAPREIWGSAKFIFKNAIVTTNGKIEDECWLYNEIYKRGNRLEIHILFTEADTIIVCDDIQSEITEKEYFRDLYEKKDKTKEKDEHYDNILNDEIVITILNKEFITGTLENWEKIIFAFAQIYYMKNFNIEDTMIYNYCNFTEDEKEEIYTKTFEIFEKNLKIYLETINKYKDVIKDIDLNYIIDKLYEVYNKQDIPIKEKNNLYLKLGENLKDIDFNKVYERILDCISKELIK